jgi:hypothetical protein
VTSDERIAASLDLKTQNSHLQNVYPMDHQTVINRRITNKSEVPIQEIGSGGLTVDYYPGKPQLLFNSLFTRLAIETWSRIKSETPFRL